MILLNHPTPTHLNSSSGTFSSIDLSLCTQSIASILEWDVLPDTHGSDHFPIILRSLIPNPNSHSPTTKWRITRADWTKFRSALNPPITQIQDTDGYIQELTQIILDAAHSAIPCTTFNRNKPPVPWWNSECSRTIRERKKALNIYKRQPTQINFIEFKKKRAQAKRTIKEAKLKSWRDLTSSLRHPLSSGHAWQLVRKMKGAQSSKIPTLSINNGYISDPKEILNSIASNYQSKSSPATAQTNSPIFSFETDQEIHYNLPFSFEELKSAISISKNSAPGPDSILLPMIQNLTEPMLSSLLKYFNHLWLNSKFPSSWLHSIVVPIHKAGKPRSLPDSYRPISLTNHFSKILERMVHQRLSWVLESKKQLSHSQYGFRKQRSAIDHLASLDTDLRSAFQKKQHTCLISLDLNNAFDITNGNVILKHLEELGFRGALPNFINNFLSPRSFQVRANGLLSDSHHLLLGVPQGSVLSPTLFNIAILPISRLIPPPLKFKLFADDLVVYSSNSSSSEITRLLQKTLTSLNAWVSNNGFSFCPPKSNSIHFCKIRNCHKMNALQINQMDIPYSSSIKILGMKFDSNLNWLPHIKHLKTRTSQDLNILRMLSNTKWGADFPSLINLYKSLILSKIRYGDFIYDSASYSAKRSLDSIQNQALRLATGAFRTSPITSLQCASATPPLHLVRQLSLMKFYSSSLQRLHIRTSLDLQNVHHINNIHPAKSIPNRIKTFITLHNLNPPTFNYPSLTTFPPWLIPAPSVDLKLHKLIKRDMTDSEIIQTFREIMHNHYPNYSIIYTDGSKSSRGVGAAFVHNQSIKHFKLPHYSSIFSAELLAIKEATNYAIRFGGNKKIVIASDSLSALMAIKSINPNYAYLRQISDLLYIAKNRDIKITFFWIPGHKGVMGNNRADKEAKLAATHGSNITGENSKDDFQKQIKSLIKNAFQLEWDLESSNNKLWNIKTQVHTPLFYPNLSRSENTTLIRLAIGHTFNTHSHLLKNEPEPICNFCNSNLTIKHLFEADHFSQLRKKHKIPSEIKHIIATFQSNKLGITNYLKELNFVI